MMHDDRRLLALVEKHRVELMRLARRAVDDDVKAREEITVGPVSTAAAKFTARIEEYEVVLSYDLADPHTLNIVDGFPVQAANTWIRVTGP